MENLSEYRWKLVGGGVLLTFIAVLYFFILPYATLVYEKMITLNDQKEQISFMANWQERLASLEEKQAELQDGMESMVINLAGEKEFSKIVEKIFEYAQSSYVDVRRIEPGIKNEQQEYIIRPVRLEIQGGYHSIARFINNVEQGDYLIVITSVSMTKETGSGSSDILNAVLSLEITLLNQPA